MLGQTTTFALSGGDRELMLAALTHARDTGAVDADEQADADALHRRLGDGEGAIRLTLNCGRVLVLRHATRAAIEASGFGAWHLTLARLHRRLEHAGYRVLR